MRPTLFLDIEAVPDAALAQRVSGIKGEGIAALATVASPKNEFEPFGFLKPLYHQVVAISIGLTEPDVSVSTLRSIGALGADERTLLERFWGGFAAMSRKNSRVVSWNGRGYDLPVLVQRGLLHGIDVSAYLSDANY